MPNDPILKLSGLYASYDATPILRGIDLQIGRGEVVLVNAEKLGLRFVEVVSQADGSKRLG